MDLPLKIKAAWCKTTGNYVYIDADGKVKFAGNNVKQMFNGSRARWNQTFFFVVQAVNNRAIKVLFHAFQTQSPEEFDEANMREINELLILALENKYPKTILCAKEKICNEIGSWPEYDFKKSEIRLCVDNTIDNNIIKVKWELYSFEMFSKFFDCSIQWVEKDVELNQPSAKYLLSTPY